MKESRCLDCIRPYLFVELNKRRKEMADSGIDVITLSVGDPDGATPPFIVEAMNEALTDPSLHHYPPYAGTDEFRHAAASYLDRRFGIGIDASTQVLALAGSKEGIVHLGNAFLDENDYALVPSIGYPAYAAAATLRGARTWEMQMTPENGYLADFSSMPDEVLSRAKIMFLGYPNNPTGACAPMSYLSEAVAFCQEHDILLAHDNAYCDICFDGYHAPAVLQVPGAIDTAIEFFSLSKGYNMTGWRIAFVAGNERAIKALSTVKSNIDSGIFMPIQHAAAVALTSDQETVHRQCSIYQRRRDILVEALNSLGLACEAPKATIYLWARVPNDESSASFANRLLEEAHVAVTPGSGYGPAGEGFIRISLSTPDDRIDEAIQRIRAFLRN